MADRRRITRPWLPVDGFSGDIKKTTGENEKREKIPKELLSLFRLKGKSRWKRN